MQNNTTNYWEKIGFIAIKEQHMEDCFYVFSCKDESIPFETMDMWTMETTKELYNITFINQKDKNIWIVAPK